MPMRKNNSTYISHWELESLDVFLENVFLGSGIEKQRVKLIVLLRCLSRV